MKGAGGIFDRTREGEAESKQTSAASPSSCLAGEDTQAGDRNSGGHSFVAMVKAAEDGDGDDLALVRALDFAGDRAVSIPSYAIASRCQA